MTRTLHQDKTLSHAVLTVRQYSGQKPSISIQTCPAIQYFKILISYWIFTKWNSKWMLW